MNNIPDDLRPVWTLAHNSCRFKNSRIKDLKFSSIYQSLMAIISSLTLKYSAILLHGISILYREKILHLLADLTEFHRKVRHIDPIIPSTNILINKSVAKILQFDPAFNSQLGLLPPLDFDLITEISGAEFQTLSQVSQTNSQLSTLFLSSNFEPEIQSESDDGLDGEEAAEVSELLQQSNLSIQLDSQPFEQSTQKKRRKIRKISHDETTSFSGSFLQRRHDEYVRNMQIKTNKTQSTNLIDQALENAHKNLPLIPRRSNNNLNAVKNVSTPVTPDSSNHSISSIEVEREGQQHRSSVQSRMSSINFSTKYQTQTPSSRYSRTPSQTDNFENIGWEDMDLDADISMDDQPSDQDSDLFLLLDLIPTNGLVSVAEIAKITNLSEINKSRAASLASTFYGLLWLAHQGHVSMIQQSPTTVHVQRTT